MANYRIVAARPKNKSNHINSSFKTYKYDEQKESWSPDGWKSISQIGDLMRAGHEVCTGKVVGGSMKTGAAVELELRIAKNGSDYKISEMPDS